MLPHDFSKAMAARGWYLKRAHDAPLSMFQVIGERATATNLVRKVIDKNVDLYRTEGLGWKHSAPHMVALPDALLTIVVVRNAVSWALSMHKRPWHAHPDLQKLDFSPFLRAEWRSIVDRPGDFEEIHPELVPLVAGAELQFDRHPITGQRFANLFALRRVKQAAHLGMLNRDCNVLVVKAELVQIDQAGFAAMLIEELGLALKGLRIKPVTSRLGNRFSRAEPVETPHELSAEDHAFMMAELDLEAEAALGYDYTPD